MWNTEFNRKDPGEVVHISRWFLEAWKVMTPIK